MTYHWNLELISIPPDGMDRRDPEALISRWVAQARKAEHDSSVVAAAILERYDLAEIERVGRDLADLLDETGSDLQDGLSFVKTYLDDRPGLPSLFVLESAWAWPGEMAELDAACAALCQVQAHLGADDQITGLACPGGNLEVADQLSGRWSPPSNMVWFIDVTADELKPVSIHAD